MNATEPKMYDRNTEDAADLARANGYASAAAMLNDNGWWSLTLPEIAGILASNNESTEIENANATSKYTLISVKGSEDFCGTEAEAIEAAKQMEDDTQPEYGVTVVDSDGETVAEIRDGEVLK